MENIVLHLFLCPLFVAALHTMETLLHNLYSFYYIRISKYKVQVEHLRHNK
jgi:hypothetical protein